MRVCVCVVKEGRKETFNQLYANAPRLQHTKMHNDMRRARPDPEQSHTIYREENKITYYYYVLKEREKMYKWHRSDVVYGASVCAA